MFIDEFKPEHLTLTEVTPQFWRVTFNNPPVNVIGPVMIKELKLLLTELETNDSVNVVVFDSADPDFYLAHYDLAADPAIAEALPSPTGYAAWVDVTVRISRLKAVTISASCPASSSSFVINIPGPTALSRVSNVRFALSSPPIPAKN